MGKGSRASLSSGDPRLKLRVLEYLGNSNTGSVHDVVDHLRQQFDQYKRLPVTVLKVNVERIMRSSLRSPISSESGSSDADMEDIKLMPAEDHNLANVNVRNIYLKRKAQDNTVVADNPMRGQGPSDKRPSAKRPRKVDSVSSARAERPTARFADIGGVEDVMKELCKIFEIPMLHPELNRHLGVKPPRGVLLHGPPGCGKTLLAHAIAGELDVPFFKISAPEIVSGMSGESEAKIRGLFADAMANAPSLIFMDEVDSITPKRDTAAREMERRIVSQLLTCMDDLATSTEAVMVIGATNRPDALDPALRRAGRFDRELSMSIPDTAARSRILKVMSSKLRLSGDFDFQIIAKSTPGFVGADLDALMKEASLLAVQRISSDIFLHDSALMGDAEPRGEYFRMRRAPFTEEELAPLAITMGDFLGAIPKVQPSIKREGFATVPDVTWRDIGALHDVRLELSRAIVEPIKHPEKYAAMGLTSPVGVLLYGPPGCGKTLLAKAAANESGANFISIKGPELLNKYVGESERAVRQVFQRGRASAPCVLFFDELDALAPRRGGGDSQASDRVVNQLLTEMDGIDGKEGVFIVAATNRPHLIDNAMLRPGRLDKLLFVPLPSAEGRAEILKTQTIRTPLDASVDLFEVAGSTKASGYSGADMSALVREATLNAMADGSTCVTRAHFEAAFQKVLPSVSPEVHIHVRFFT
eukprot:TRINITY_DN7507_c0_g1_i2.p1 TRINITY_DN7507_c0_g1~~TRINITY_DN7507_c0_g1_i2.p1  ORF type:complete len:702 (-),score=86.25 TRINITY_DN7507_c0_g1_i2:804-2909(-)